MNSSFAKSILVTGGAGFVGSSLALHFKGRHPRTRIVCMDNLYRRGSELNVPRFQEAGVEFVKGDIRFVRKFPSWRPKRDVIQIVSDVFEWVRAHERELKPFV
jgi:nucleoside-diphosphate-sugar epimerase